MISHTNDYLRASQVYEAIESNPFNTNTAGPGDYSLVALSFFGGGLSTMGSWCITQITPFILNEDYSKDDKGKLIGAAFIVGTFATFFGAIIKDGLAWNRKDSTQTILNKYKSFEVLSQSDVSALKKVMDKSMWRGIEHFPVCPDDKVTLMNQRADRILEILLEEIQSGYDCHIAFEQCVKLSDKHWVTISLVKKINETNVRQMHSFAEKFDLKILKNTCKEFYKTYRVQKDTEDFFADKKLN